MEAAITILKLASSVCAGTLESVTFTVNAKVPDWVGVPVIAPEVALSDSPAGSWPEEIVQP